MKNSTSNVAAIISLVLRAVAMAMAVAAIVMSILNAAEPGAIITLLSIGLFTLALDALDRDSESESVS